MKNPHYRSVVIDMLVANYVVPFQPLFELGEVVAVVHAQGFEQCAIGDQYARAQESALMALVNPLIQHRHIVDPKYGT